MKSYQIHLIRHGITDANKNGCYIGSTDLPLSDLGKSQLLEIKNGARYPKSNIIYTSPLKRCIQTCEILYPENQYISVPGLSECDFGNWEGKSAKELENDQDFKKWLEDSSKNPPPNGESSIKFTHRICLTFEKIVEGLMRAGTTTAVIVTHSGVLTTLLAAYGLPKANPMDWVTNPGCGYSLRITPSLWMRDMVAEVYERLPIFEDIKEDTTSMEEI